MKNKLNVILGVFVTLLTLFFVPKVANAADFGAISGTIVWDSETPLYQGIGFRLRFVGTNTGTNVLTFSNNCSSTSCIYNSDFTLPTDTYTVNVYQFVGGAPNSLGQLLASQTAVVNSNQSVTLDINLSEITGLVKGSLSINGVASPGKVQFCNPEPDPCPIPAPEASPQYQYGPWINFSNPEQQGFKMPLLPGNYRVHVLTQDNISAGIVPVTVVVGEIKNDSNLQFQLNFGSISGSLTWGSEIPMYSGGSFRLRFVGTSTGTDILMFSNTCSASSCLFSSGFVLPPDTYTVNVYQFVGGAPNSLGQLLASPTVVVGSDDSVNLNVDLSTTTGLIQGNFLINGVASLGKVQFCAPAPAECPTPAPNANPQYQNGPWINFSNLGFKFPLISGDYRLHVMTTDNLSVGIVPITLIAGQLINDSSLQFQLNFGSISGSLTWGSEIPMYAGGTFRMRFLGNNTGTDVLTFSNTCSTASCVYSSGVSLPPDTYTVNTHQFVGNAPNQAGQLLASSTIIVGSGDETTLNIDLSDTSGLVKGNLVINNMLSPGKVQFCAPAPAECPTPAPEASPQYQYGPWINFFNPGQLGFKLPVLSGDYRVHVMTQDNVSVGIIPITVTVGNVVNLPPTITTTFFPAATASAIYNQTIQTIGGTAPFDWVIVSGELPLGLTLNTLTGNIEGIANTPGSYDFTVQVVDVNSQITTQDFTIIVNPAPVIQTNLLSQSTRTVPYNQTFAANGGTSPLTWSIVSGNLPDGLSLDSGTGVIFGTPTIAENLTFTVQVTDANSVSDTQEFAIIVNDIPAITTPSLPNGTEGITYAQLVGVSGGTNSLVWSVENGGLPQGLELNIDTGEISGTPAIVGNSTFTIRVTDANGATTSQIFTLTVDPAIAIVTSGNLPDVTVGGTYSQSVSATGGTFPLTWSVVSGSLPDGISLDSTTGVFSGIPTTVGAYNFTLQVTDVNNHSATQAQSINVNPAPIITTTTLAPTTINVSYSQSLQKTGGTPNFNWTIVSGTLPIGLTLDAAMGVISGTPTVSGTTTFAVQITDGYGIAGTQTLTLTINQVPTIKKQHLPDKKIGHNYSQSINVQGGTYPLTWSVVSGVLPTGLVLDSATGVLSGVPTEVGVYNFTIQVIDVANATDSHTYTVEIKN